MNLSPESWLKDKRGNFSFTRIAPAICLLAVLIIWGISAHWVALQDHADKAIDKLLEFARWAFGAGKIAEEAGEFAKPSSSTTTSSSVVKVETPEKP